MSSDTGAVLAVISLGWGVGTIFNAPGVGVAVASGLVWLTIITLES